ncbi:hypothetical protein [Streptomyces viridochromogenes]|uniref:hypothetical protein n=1 Tax=Streptomyces viridochromogenes TaxID=1938 RepID=UPI0031DA02A5
MTANAFTAGRERYYRLELARGDGARGAEPAVFSNVPECHRGCGAGREGAVWGCPGS